MTNGVNVIVSDFLFSLVFPHKCDAHSLNRLLSLLQADYLQEASLLMAKLCYVEGEYRDALGKPHALWSASLSILLL